MSASGQSRVPRQLVWPIVAVAIAGFLVLPELFPGNSRLYLAIAEGDATRVAELLAEGADPNSRSSGLSGLGGGFELDPSGQYSPLLYAISRNEAGIALALVIAGADPNEHDPDGDSALMVAADQGMTGVVRALLEHGADPRAENRYNGSTLLHHGRLLSFQGQPAPKTYADPELDALLRDADRRTE